MTSGSYVTTPFNITIENDTDDHCYDFEEKIAFLSDPFHAHPPYVRALATWLYVFVTVVGAAGNFLVILSVACNAQMRTPRNYFVISLASSDFLMCTVTVPFTVYNTLNTFWNLGSPTCKIVSALQGVNLFVSTISITAIGLDRYWVILFPTQAKQQRVVLGVSFVAIWLLSVAFASPMFFATTLRLLPACGHLLPVCAENWEGMPFRQSSYSVGCVIFQYLLPIAMLTFLYGRIFLRLKRRFGHSAQNRNCRCPMVTNAVASNTQNVIDERSKAVKWRQRRTNALLISIVLAFAVSWLPLNIYNANVSFGGDYDLSVFAFCHIVGVTSACVNPVLYGLLNENFRAEFKRLLCAVLCCKGPNRLGAPFSRSRAPPSASAEPTRKLTQFDNKTQSSKRSTKGRSKCSLSNLRVELIDCRFIEEEQERLCETGAISSPLPDN